MPQVLLVPIVDFSTTQSLAPPTPHFSILVYTVLKYFPQFYTHPHLAGILVYTVLKYFPQYYTHPQLGRYFSLHGTKMTFDQRDPTHVY